MFSNWLRLRKDGTLKEKFILRAKILSLIRDFFYQESFLEVETPSLVRLPGMEPYLDPIRVELPNGGKEKNLAYLTTSPEYAMKKLLVAGFPKIFQICKSFRGGELADDLHNPEFTILEWYRSKANYNDIMVDVEKLLVYILNQLIIQNKKLKIKNKNLRKNFIKYHGQTIDLSLPWPRLTVKESFQKYAGIDLDKILDLKSIAAVARKKSYAVNRDDRFDDIFFKIFLSEVEPNLDKGRPTILMDWPAEMAALSRKKTGDPRYAERFEIYIGGLELGNAFSELTDAEEQKRRLLDERLLRKKLDKDLYDVDEEFVEALKIGMPPSGGIAMGVDRIVMLFTDSKNIEEILFFPAKQIF